MLKKIIKKIKKLKNNGNPDYIKYCGKPVDNHLVLVEGGQGTNINGNMFAMLKEIMTNPRWNDFNVAFVVTQQNFSSAKQRMAFYGFSRVKIVIKNSKEYSKSLATAKYIMTDNSFPPFFNKRSEQVYLNTWHGTPLKTLGKSNKSSLKSLANIQKNYLMSDYALFPNEFTKNVFMTDYYLENMFKGKSLIANYPRNYIFYDEKSGCEMKKRLGYENKKLFAYMPTWRDASTQKQKLLQIETVKNILREFDEKADESQILLVNLHFLLASNIDCSEFSHVKYFPYEYDTYEILNACDGLITDYSSVFFDFAITRKKIILFAYDKEDYLNSRGLYMSFESLPFPVVESVSGLLDEMAVPATISEKFIEDFCPNGRKNSCELIFELMVTGKSDVFDVEDHAGKENNTCLIYSGALPSVHLEGLKYYIENNPQNNYIIAYRRNLSQKQKESVESINGNISLFGIMNLFNFSFKEFFIFSVLSLFGIMDKSKHLNCFFEREKTRLFYSFSPSIVIDSSCANSVIAHILSRFSCEKFFINHGDFYYVKKRNYDKIHHIKNFEGKKGFKPLELGKIENEAFFNNNTDNLAHISLRKNSAMKNILPLYINIGKKMICISLFSLKTACKTMLKNTVITVGEKEYNPIFFASKSKNSKKHFGIYCFSVPIEDVLNLPATNIVALRYKDKYGYTVICHIIYIAPIGKFLGLRGPMCIDDNTQTVAIFRQSLKNRLNIYVRSVNRTDCFKERLKQGIAFIFSLFWNTSKTKKIVLLYEKNSSKYEESASVLFEKLIDKGYDNTFFIVTRDYEFLDSIPKQYFKNIIYKYSFKHYLYFFKCKSFIGTEAMAHAIDLKTFNILPLLKINSKKYNYVFLQHGVMYMVSLSSEARSMFNRKKLNGKYRVVVSSKTEANHFTTLGKHLPEDLYITGLPKFDRNEHNMTADKIIIMPTWRPWEINEARTDFSKTPYFEMIMRIYNNIPEKLKEKVIILPHPLIAAELSKLSCDISDKIALNVKYDDVLKETAVLITDYSSIAYDAFYRGARVIFYWEEKDYCMSQYGPSTKLMLNEENVFGDFLYSSEMLEKTIELNYYNPQTPEQIEKYSKIVEFHDGKNTERLIKLLKNDGII